MSDEKILKLLEEIAARCTEQGDNCETCKMSIPYTSGHCCLITALAEELTEAPSGWNFKKIKKILNGGEE